MRGHPFQRRRRCGLAPALLLAAAPAAQADSFCMLAAESYYQQLYCEVIAGGGRGTLPSFADFKRNTPTVQALLLKRPAKRLGIEVALPRRDRQARIAVDPAPAPPSRPPRTAETRPPSGAAAPASRAATGLPACRLEGVTITCDTARYALVGNQTNQHLRPGALDDNNRMDLPVFAGNLAAAASVNDYLYRAYQRYVEKMLEIGLGGATMNYGKFAYLFKDLSEKGVDFAGRFETMYRFLKKDKAQLGVSSQVRADAQLTLADCGALGERIIVCGKSGRNYVYRYGK